LFFQAIMERKKKLECYFVKISNELKKSSMECCQMK
jgi:hypothetical protein